MDKILGRVIIKADLIVETGLHIGGGNSSLEIGGIDNSVIKNYKGQPYIPGSSLKGKLRSLTELTMGKLKRKENGEASQCNCGMCEVCKIYGSAATSNSKESNIEVLPTRLIVRDAFLKPDIAEEMKNKEGKFKNLELEYTESKWENTIDRVTSKANPRIVERVPEGTIFETEFIYTIYNEEDINNLKVLFAGFQYLEDDYLGANGTRGYGKVKFKDINISLKLVKDYKVNEIDKLKCFDNMNYDFISKIKENIQCE